MDRHSLTFDQISDRPAEVFDRFGIISQPAAVIVAADGELRTLVGRADGDTISTELAAVVG